MTVVKGLVVATLLKDVFVKMDGMVCTVKTIETNVMPLQVPAQNLTQHVSIHPEATCAHVSLDIK